MHVERAHRSPVRPFLLKMRLSMWYEDASIYAKIPLITHMALIGHTQA